MMKENYEHFNTLNAINVNDRTEKKNGLTYLSWAWAWTEVKKQYPDAKYEIKKFENNLPYVYDDKTGYMVFTEVTIEGITHEMWLPVMDGANKTMLDHPYTYQVKDKKNGGFVEKQVEVATMFDVNKTIMRCLTKNLAMFGLGLSLYQGEDLSSHTLLSALSYSSPQTFIYTIIPKKRTFCNSVTDYLFCDFKFFVFSLTKRAFGAKIYVAVLIYENQAFREG